LKEGISIAREMYREVRSAVQGVQISAPLGRVDAVLMVIEG